MRVKISRTDPYHSFGKFEIERLPEAGFTIDIEFEPGVERAVPWKVVQVIVREPETPEIVIAETWRVQNLRARKESS